MNDDSRWSPEAEQKEKEARKTAIIIICLVSCLFLFMFLAVGIAWKYVFQALLNEQENPMPDITMESERITEAATSTLSENTSMADDMDEYLAERLAYIEETERLTEHLGTGYDSVWPVTAGSMSCIVKKDGKWGMASVNGEVLVPLKYDRYSFMDNTGWVEFEQNGHFYVYDEQGELVQLYSDKTSFRMESEEAYLFRTAKAYMSGMEITTTIPEILEDDYYGVEYRSRSTGKLLYSALGGYAKAGVFTFPDETGRAVAIQGDGLSNTIYYITEDGCESRVMELPEDVNGRWFDFPADYTWADISLSNGWLKVYVCDAVPGFLIDDYKYYTAFFNVDTLELVPFPEEYQTYFTIYDMGYGDAIAIRMYNEEDEYYKYAICKGDKKLTEEMYYWVEFGEKFMVAGQDNGVDILNYEGEVLATFWDISGSFVNGKVLVWDRNGVYFIDENLERCSEYLFNGQIDGCFSRGVIIDDLYYMLDEFAQ